MLETASVSGASIVFIWVSNGVEVLATETTQLIGKELRLVTKK